MKGMEIRQILLSRIKQKLHQGSQSVMAAAGMESIAALVDLDQLHRIMVFILVARLKAAHH
jgi:hypothetical protein